MTRGFTNKSDYFFITKKKTKMQTFESIFQKNSGGNAPDLPSLTRGLQTNVLSFYGKKGL